MAAQLPRSLQAQRAGRRRGHRVQDVQIRLTSRPRAGGDQRAWREHRRGRGDDRRGGGGRRRGQRRRGEGGPAGGRRRDQHAGGDGGRGGRTGFVDRQVNGLSLCVEVQVVSQQVLWRFRFHSAEEERDAVHRRVRAHFRRLWKQKGKRWR